MGLIQQIEDDYKKALKNRDSGSVDIFRILKMEFKNAEIAKREDDEKELSEEEAIAIVRRQIKQLEEAKAMFSNAGRDELVEKNQREIDILARYLPQMMSEEDVKGVIKKIVDEMEEGSDFGKIMGMAMKELKGKADGGIVSKVVKEILG